MPLKGLSFLFILWIAAEPQTSFAEYLASDLLRNCQNVIDMQSDTTTGYVKSPGSTGICIGYMQGFDDMQFQMAYALSGFSSNLSKITKFRLYCKPKGVTYGQEAKIVVTYLNNHPEELHYSAGSELMLILTTHFPCKNS